MRMCRSSKLASIDNLNNGLNSDWKHGDGKQKIHALLEQADPTPEAPVTVIEVICTGRAIVRTIQMFEGQKRKG